MEIQNQLNELQNTKTTLSTAIQSLQQIEDGYAQADASIASAQGELDGMGDLDAKVAQLETDRAQLAALVGTEEEPGLVAQAETALAEKQQAVDDKQGAIDELNGQLAALEDPQGEDSDERIRLEGEIAAAEAEMPALTADRDTGVDEIMSLHEDALTFVGGIGRMEFMANGGSHAKGRFHRVDYAKYKSGEKNYIIKNLKY